MEKFALLNLLKAIDGLNSISQAEKTPPPPPAANTTESESVTQNMAMPNVMYETLLRHEAVSNRLRNKR